jgi:hypothetical protein
LAHGGLIPSEPQIAVYIDSLDEARLIQKSAGAQVPPPRRR